jgi:hypothetical protein
MIYSIPEFGIEVEVPIPGGLGTIKSGLKEILIGKNSPKEFFESQFLEGAANAIDSLILAHACAGINVGSTDYVNGLRTCIEAIGNNI